MPIQMTEGDKAIGRRNFLKAAAALPAVGAFTYSAANAGPVKIGIVGTGLEGRILIEAMDKKYTYVTAMCDIRPDNQAIGAWWIESCGHAKREKSGGDLKVYDKYEDMLQDPNVEAIIVTTPLIMHGPMIIQALQAGKHVFTEKTMAYNLEDCLEATKLSREKGLNLQIGHQRFYNPLYWDAYRMAKEGLLGHICHIRMLWHRNFDWNYWYHVEDKHYDGLVKFDPTPWGYKDIQELVNWRWYQRTSHGLWTELTAHQLAITNWLAGDQTPTAISATGGRFKTDEDQLLLPLYDKFPTKGKLPDGTEGNIQERKRHYKTDDRDTNDHVFAIYEYGDKFTVTGSYIQSNSYDQYYEQIMGTFGTVILSNENQYYLFWEPGWDEAKAKDAASGVKATSVGVEGEEETGSAFAAHVSGEATGGGGASDMSPTEPYKWELMGFADTIRRGAPNLCDAKRGAQAAYACMKSMEAVKAGKKIEVPPLNI